jgi:hypothetical protein
LEVSDTLNVRVVAGRLVSFVCGTGFETLVGLRDTDSLHTSADSPTITRTISVASTLPLTISIKNVWGVA